MTKSTHVIEEYSVSEDTILCVCGWSGFTADFRQHQIESAPTKIKPSPDKYKSASHFSLRRSLETEY